MSQTRKDGADAPSPRQATAELQAFLSSFYMHARHHADVLAAAGSPRAETVRKLADRYHEKSDVLWLAVLDGFRKKAHLVVRK